MMARSPHILIVEDDREIRTMVLRFLQKHGFRVSAADNARAMDKILADARIDLMVLDIMLPGEDGLSICRRIRVESAMPVIMLTASGEPTARVVGLEMGADDYIPKPFDPHELLARIKAVLRRANAMPTVMQAAAPAVMRFSGWQLNSVARELINPENSRVILTSAEFELLTAFCRHPQRTLTRDQLLDLTQGRAGAPLDRSIDILVSRIRRKIERDPRFPDLIKTVRSGGYIFTPDVTPE
jgi:two-component system OmpR family response regulator